MYWKELTAGNENGLKMAVFWVIVQCSQKFTNVSEFLAASVIRVMVLLNCYVTPHSGHVF